MLSHIRYPAAANIFIYFYLNNTYINGSLKKTRYVTMNIFRIIYFLFKSFVKKELSYVFTINMFSTAKNCMGSELLYKTGVFSLVCNY